MGKGCCRPTPPKMKAEKMQKDAEGGKCYLFVVISLFVCFFLATSICVALLIMMKINTGFHRPLHLCLTIMAIATVSCCHIMPSVQSQLNRLCYKYNILSFFFVLAIIIKKNIC